ncbi:hypothetical protein J4438_01825 [Candidatus Woesearchaeota archaeon]|nr:hypothetical protein [Candidatus Woesearchaeota archaeon]
METDISDIAVLCVDPVHKRCGQVGKLIYHDSRESGLLQVEFADGRRVQFPDGGEPRDEWKPVERFYRHNDKAGRAWDSSKDKAGPEGLKARYLGLNVGTIDDLAGNYLAVFREKLE